MAFGNNYSGNYQQWAGYQPQQPYAFSAQPQPSMVAPMPKTNKIFVTGLQDAINRPAEPNSVLIYIDQDNPLLYEITTDAQGRKSYQTLELRQNNPITATKEENPTNYSTKDELAVLTAQMSAIAERVARLEEKSTAAPRKKADEPKGV